MSLTSPLCLHPSEPPKYQNYLICSCFPLEKASNKSILTSSLMWRSKLLSCWSLLGKKNMVQTICDPFDPNTHTAAHGMGMMKMLLLPNLDTLRWRKWEWEYLVDGNLAPKLSPFFLQHPEDLSLCYACLWSSTLKFCPESSSCSILGHTDILSLLLLFFFTTI